MAIVIPVLNEAAHIEGVLTDLAPQAVASVVEILVVDGGSTDRTREIVAHRAARDRRIRLIHNPKRLQSAAVNHAAEIANPEVEFLVRADAHARYPAGFVDDLLVAAQRSGAQSVVNQLRSLGRGCFQQAVAAVSNSRLGTGGALHRIGGREGFVDHGHHALFDRQWFLKVGGYDENFIANEDAEFDFRLRAAGGKIWFTAGAIVDYFPRATISGLAKQYYRYGRGRASNRRKHGEALRLRQLVPPIMTLAILAGTLSSIFWLPALTIPGLYGVGVAAASALLAWRARNLCVLGAIIALPVMHLSWGSGFLLEAFWSGNPVSR